MSDIDNKLLVATLFEILYMSATASLCNVTTPHPLVIYALVLLSSAVWVYIIKLYRAGEHTEYIRGQCIVVLILIPIINITLIVTRGGF